MLILFLSQAALAQDAAPAQPTELDAQNYQAPIDSEMTLWTDDASLRHDGYFGVRLWGNYVKNPLVYEFTDDTATEEVLVGDVLQTDLIGFVSFKRIRLGLDVPLFLMANGSQVNTGTGLGSIGLDLKGTILDTDDAPLGLALGGRIDLPTTTIDAPLGGDTLGGEVSLIVDKRIDNLLLAANLGSRFDKQIALENVTVDDIFFWRVGAGYAITDNGGLSLDLAGDVNYSAPLSNSAGAPIEGLVGGWGRAGNFVGRLGVGTGLTRGIGSPDFRTVFSFAYEPPTDKDTDLDGIVDRDDRCPTDPEDKDGWQDDDGCPDPTTKVMVRFVDEDGYAVEGVVSTVTGPGQEPATAEGSYEIGLHAGTYQLQAEAGGYDPVAMEAVVPSATQHELVVQMKALPATLVINVKDDAGKPLDAQWTVGGTFNEIKGGTTENQVKPGRFVIRVQAEGYRTVRQPLELAPGERKTLDYTLQPSKIVVTKEKIDLREEVYFDTGKSSIKNESFNMLKEVAGVLKDNPDITKVRIEGHTDSRGASLTNQKLSEARAAAVRQYLIDNGVEEGRLYSIGFGEDKPLVKGNNEAAWSKNRRVDIFIEERTGGE
ncbi:MAG: OmpA family protein [Alphaproteobacteria bacterium]|nr:OmpA family protein [Alphaproteobacteria bacterium]